MEYQFYEFCAIDRPLTSQERDRLNQLSSRAQVTSHRAVYTYSYGDFRGDCLELMGTCFDMGLYVANWGSRHLWIRLPHEALDRIALAPYCFTLETEEDSHGIELHQGTTGDILEMKLRDEEGGGWVDEEGSLSILLGIREEVLRGDYRSLYMAWLAIAQASQGEDVFLEEPPVPPNLGSLSPALSALANWFQVSPDLLAAAAAASPDRQAVVDDPVHEWLAALPEQEKTLWLQRLLQGEPRLDLALRQALQKRFGTPSAPASDPSAARRSIEEIVALADSQAEARDRQEREVAQSKRQRYLEGLAPDRLWSEARRLAGERRSPLYQQAVSLLVDLRDAAKLRGDLPGFQAGMQKFAADYQSLRSLMTLLKKEKLI